MRVASPSPETGKARPSRKRGRGRLVLDERGVQVWHGKALDVLHGLDDGSIDLVLTDPPYFIDGMDDGWNRKALGRKKARAGVVGALPVGMKFDPEQGKRLQAFLEPVFVECLRVLKPGGFLVSFSQARLYHRMAMAAEQAGFEIRDMFGWTYEGQAKAFSPRHFVTRMTCPERDKETILAAIGDRKTPQVKPMIEPMVFGQKPRDGTFIENWMAHGVGLIDPGALYDGRFPGNLMAAGKPGDAERGGGNDHFTVKPQKVLTHLIRLLTREGAIVLDPFLGSGSTLVAAIATGRRGIGVEKAAAHVAISKRRVRAVETATGEQAA